MNIHKEYYLNELREESSYGSFRKLVKVFEVLGYAVSVVIAVSYFVGGALLLGVAAQINEMDVLGEQDTTLTTFSGILCFVLGLLLSLLSAAGVRFLAKGAEITADAGDSLLESGSRGAELKMPRDFTSY